MEALVEQAVAIVVEPQDLDPVATLAREHEESAGLGIELESLADGESKRVERTPHVLPLGADEDTDLRRNHRRRSRMSSRRRSVLSSKPAGTRTRLPLMSTTSSDSAAEAGATSTNEIGGAGVVDSAEMIAT